MTTINDISDLIRILRDDPAWADAVRSVLLSQELLRLPEEVAALTKAFREHAETTNRRLESLERGQAQLQTTVNGMGEELGNLRRGQAQLQTTVNGMGEELGNLRRGQAQLQTTVNGMRGELGNLSGSFFQRRAANFAQRVARRDFHLRQTRFVHHADQIGDNVLKQMINDAAEDASRDFTEEDAALVEQADAVVMGKAPDNTEVYLLVEASITIVKDDVDRAKNRAELLQRAIGAIIHAVVIGETITDDAATQAKNRAVTFAAFTPRRSPPQDLNEG